MNYICDFDIGTVLFFGLTIFFYLTQKRLRNLPDRIFTAMLVCAMVAAVFDTVAAMMERYAMLYPAWLLYAVNMLFIIGMQSCLPLFFLYAVATAGKFHRFSVRKKLLAAIPHVVTMLLLLLSPFIDFGICFIDETHIYRHGPTHEMLYINMGVYVIMGVIVLLKNSRRIQRARRNVILLFVALLFIAMALQLAFPQYLLTASATALALTSVFYVLQSPIDQVDPLTGAFSRTQLYALLEDRVEGGRAYALLMLSLRSFDAFLRMYGEDAGNALLAAYSRALMTCFSDGIVVYMDTSEFIVVRDGALTRREAEALQKRLPLYVTVGGYGEVRMNVSFGAASYGAGEANDADITVADCMLREMRAGETGAMLYADAEYKRACRMTLGLEASLGELLDSNIRLARQPIMRADGTLAAEEAWLRVPDEMTRYVSPEQFLQAVGQGGHAQTYYRTLLTALRGRSGFYREDRRLCIPLLSAVLLQDDAPESIQTLAASRGFLPDQLLFAVNEADVALSVPVLTENMRRLTDMGFAIMLDAFAEGYTDMSLMLSLPIWGVRLHESFIKNAAKDRYDAKLLNGLTEVVKDLGVAVVCPGIDSEAERQVALNAGAALLQGACTGNPYGY